MPDGPARDAILLSERDNVATVLRPVEAGDVLRLDGATEIRARDAVPLCHKVALSRIEAGSPVVKYGQPIGLATEAIEAGRHVHVHNMRSARARAAVCDV